MEYQKKRLEDIRPYENNPRINDDAVEDVMESIRQCSYIAPIVVDEDGVILAGHTRYKALLRLGYDECDVIVAEGLNEEQKRKYRLYDNKTAELAEWDQRKLIEELSDDFGKPSIREDEDGEGEEKDVVTMVCPCCGEVFEI